MADPHPQLKAVLKFLKTNEVIITFCLGFLLVVGLGLSIVGKNWWRENHRPSIDQQAASIITTDTSQLPVIKNNSEQLNMTTEYIVKKGDSTWKVAELFFDDGEAYPQIEQANQLHHNQQLKVGQKLIIPTLTVKNFPDPHNDYLVKTGDCLWTIAETQLGSGYRWVDIYRDNRKIIGRNPNRIYPATVLHLPSRR